MTWAFTKVSASTKNKMSPRACLAPALRVRGNLPMLHSEDNVRSVLPRHRCSGVSGGIIHDNNLVRLANRIHSRANG